MKIRIVSVGKVKHRFVLEGEQKYLARFQRDWPVEFLELGLSSPDSLPEAQVRKKEADKVLPLMRDGGYCCVLDEGGTRYDSRGFARFIQDIRERGIGSVTFYIGGAFGWDQSVKQKADSLLSLSSLTFPYQISRLLLVEQLYRSYSLIHGKPYHK